MRASFKPANFVGFRADADTEHNVGDYLGQVTKRNQSHTKPRA